MIIINGVIHTADGPAVPRGFVAWEGERVAAVGPMDALPRRDWGPVLDANGGHVTPGYIDAHCHLGLFPDGRSYDDACPDGPGPAAPDFDPLARADLADRCFAEALRAGVTTVAVAPGSRNPVAGRVACVRTDGRVLRTDVALKLALGQTPEGTAGLDAAGLAGLLSDALEPRRGRAVHLHVHRASDIRTALDLAGRFDLRLTLVHGTEGYLLADAIAAAGVSVITGPAMTDRSRAELKGLTLELPAVLARAGVKLAICTDHPETPAQYLPLCAALAVRGGLDEEAALAAITRNAADILGLDGLGTLAPGKTADVVVTPGHPLDGRKKPRAVFLGGKQVL